MPASAVPPLTTLRIYYFVTFAVLGVYLPFFPTWLEAQQLRGASIGVVTAAMPAMSVIGPPAFGLLADALGLRGGILRLSCAGALLAFAAIAATSHAGVALGFAGLLSLVAIFAFFRSPMVMIADVLALESASAAGTSYGRLRMWGSLGFLLAAIAVGRFLDVRSAALPMAISAALLLALVTSFSLPAKSSLPARPVPGQLRALLSSTDFQLFLVAAFLGQGAQSAYDLCYSRHLRDLGAAPAEHGIAWAIGVGAEMALFGWGGALFARVPAPRLLVIAFSGACLRWILIALVRSPAVLLMLQPLHALSFGLMWVASLSYAKERAGPGQLATAQGVFTASAAAGMVVGMPAWGELYQRRGGPTTFVVAAVVSAFAAAVAFLLALRERRRPGRPSPT
jgi:PPP family 3-phenylpropionic acid transporter